MQFMFPPGESLYVPKKNPSFILAKPTNLVVHAGWAGGSAGCGLIGLGGQYTSKVDEQEMTASLNMSCIP